MLFMDLSAAQNLVLLGWFCRNGLLMVRIRYSCFTLCVLKLQCYNLHMRTVKKRIYTHTAVYIFYEYTFVMYAIQIFHVCIDHAMYRTWWWDSWVEPNNLYHIFQPFSTFVSRLKLAQYTWNLTNPQVSADNLRAWKGGSEMVVVWIQDDCYTWPHQGSGQTCRTLSGLQLTINCNAKSGTYV